jgi:tetratricopeptide (TPR) repeat protein
MEEYIVRRVGRRVLRLQSVEKGVVRYLHLEDTWDHAEGEVIGIQVTRRWRLGGSRHIMGEIVRTRVDLDALQIEPRPLEEKEDGLFAFQTLPQDRTVSRLIDDAADDIRRGRCECAAELLHRVLDAEPSCIDAYNHLGLLAERDGLHRRALRYYRIAYLIGSRSLPRSLPGPIPWCYPSNRPYLRAAHGYGLELWRIGRSEAATEILRHLLVMDEGDPFGARTLLDDIEAGVAPWAQAVV